LGLTIARVVPTNRPGPVMRFGSFVREGTIVTLLVTDPGKSIIGLDATASKLTSFKDDKQADLLKAKPKPRNQGMVFNLGPDDNLPRKGENGTDGHSCLIEVRGPALPTSGASKITLKGTLVFNCSAAEKTAELKNVAASTVEPSNLASVKWTRM